MNYFEEEILELDGEIETLKYDLSCERAAFEQYETLVKELVSEYEIALHVAIFNMAISTNLRAKLDRLKIRLGLVDAIPNEY